MHGDTLKYPFLLDIILETINGIIQQRIQQDFCIIFTDGWYFFTLFGPLNVSIAVQPTMCGTLLLVYIETDFYSRGWYCRLHDSPSCYSGMVIRFYPVQQSKEVQGDALKYPSLLNIILETINGIIQQRIQQDFCIIFTDGWYFFTLFGPLNVSIAVQPTMCGTLLLVYFLHCTDQTFFIDGFGIF